MAFFSGYCQQHFQEHSVWCFHLTSYFPDGWVLNYTDWPWQSPSKKSHKGQKEHHEEFIRKLYISFGDLNFLFYFNFLVFKTAENKHGKVCFMGLSVLLVSGRRYFILHGYLPEFWGVLSRCWTPFPTSNADSSRSSSGWHCNWTRNLWSSVK